jgi:decaprenylphospho-beta-D-ribofuranose 2-oxidase
MIATYSRSTRDAGTARLLSGWGRTGATAARVATPTHPDQVCELLVAAGKGRGAIARGLGRSYGDAAQCAGGTVIATDHLDAVGPVGEVGRVTVGGGASLQQVMTETLPKGWWVPVTPGTRQVTVGGAVAADIHGKNHHVDGSFCQQVTSLTLATPVGLRKVGPDRDPELFWATAGGMGLTGVVVEAELQLVPVETAWMTVDTEQLTGVEAAMATMAASDDSFRYSVAWVDASLGRRRGRTVLTRGDHAPRSALASPKQPFLTLPGRSALRIPFAPPRNLVGAAAAFGLGELWFRRSSERRRELTPIGSYFHPLDQVATWNLLYGPSGLVQYQYVVGEAAAGVVPETLELLDRYRVPSTLAVLKRFGPSDPGPLSFPMAGWTLALDFPAGHPRLAPLLASLDEMVVEAGGRVYLAKDSRLPSALLKVMYPRHEKLAAARKAIDPDSVLASDLSRRLGLDGNGATA